jgi:hypothetical protein
MVSRIVLPLSLLLWLFLTISTHSQTLSQYFDGADTSAWNSLIIEFDPDPENIWQIGPPQKTIFNGAATIPNVIVTDTIHGYPPDNVSRFSFKIEPDYFQWGILALQWKQKLDLDAGQDGGVLEFSLDNGLSWENVFNNPYVYNFYGFDPANQMTLPSGVEAFSGTDTLWKDIWLCFDVSFLFLYDSIPIRYTLVSDGNDSGKEGWMLDNMLAHITIIHTVNEEPANTYFHVYPTVTNDRVDIETVKMDAFHIIEKIEVINISGEVVEHHGPTPTRFYLSLNSHPPGLYYLLIETNKKSGVFPIILTR